MTGLGVCDAEFPTPDVAEMGRVSERARFKGELRGGRRPRDLIDGDHAFPGEDDVNASSPEQLVAMGARSKFPEVPYSMAKSASWRVAISRKWRHKEKILELEAEAGAFAVRKLSRLHSARGLRHVILSDNMACVCAFTKGRSTNYGVLRRCQEVCALTLALDIDVV